MKSLLKIILLCLSCVHATTFSQSCLPEGIEFSSQAQIDSFSINYPGCHEIEGDLVICGETINNLIGLRKLMAIDGDLVIRGNKSLVQLTGFENLSSIGGDLIVGGWGELSNLILSHLTGLENLEQVEGDIIIKYNPVLVDLIGLDYLKEVGGTLQINDNLRMVSFQGLEGLLEVKKDIYIDSNPLLVNFYGLKNLERIGGDFYVTKNSGLYNFNGLEKLTTIGGSMFVGSECTSCGNPLLNNLKGLGQLKYVEQGLTIANNENLINIAALHNFNSDSLERLVIMNNPKLSSCDYDFICDFIFNNAGALLVSNNAPGCKDVEDILTKCNGSSITEQSDYYLNASPNPFNSTVSISFELKGIETAELAIFDEMGKIVFTETMAGKLNQLIWKPVNEKPGVYFITIQSQKNFRTIKLIKIK